jgi:hypothetical protein
LRAFESWRCGSAGLSSAWIHPLSGSFIFSAVEVGVFRPVEDSWSVDAEWNGGETVLQKEDGPTRRNTSEASSHPSFRGSSHESLKIPSLFPAADSAFHYRLNLLPVFTRHISHFLVCVTLCPLHFLHSHISCDAAAHSLLISASLLLSNATLHFKLRTKVFFNFLLKVPVIIYLLFMKASFVTPRLRGFFEKKVRISHKKHHKYLKKFYR